MHRLRRIEVVALELDTREQLRWTLRWSGVYHLGEILDYEAQVGIALGECDADEAEGTANLMSGLVYSVFVQRSNRLCRGTLF